MPVTIEKIRELMAKATKDKWTSDGRAINGEHGKSIIDTGCGCCCSSGANAEEDFHFIAALPEIAQLCLDQAAEIETLRGKTFAE